MFVLTIHAIIYLLFFFFNDTATTEIYTLSLHDALPILSGAPADQSLPLHVLLRARGRVELVPARKAARQQDRKSTRLNSSHSQISYAVFCLKKKKKNSKHYRSRIRSEPQRTHECLKR